MFDPAATGIIVACILVFLLITGTHIGVGLGISGFIGILITINERAAFAQVATVPFSTTNSSLWRLSPSSSDGITGDPGGADNGPL